MIVDNHDDSIAVATYVLEQVGCRCVPVRSALQGLHFAAACQPDLMVLDIFLPGFNGFEMLRRLRHNPQTIAIPVIATSALASEEDRIQALKMGCMAYFTKPFILDDLKLVLEHHFYGLVDAVGALACCS